MLARMSAAVRATSVAQDTMMAPDAPEPLVATLTDRQLHKPGEEPSGSP